MRCVDAVVRSVDRDITAVNHYICAFQSFCRSKVECAAFYEQETICVDCVIADFHCDGPVSYG